MSWIKLFSCMMYWRRTSYKLHPQTVSSLSGSPSSQRPPASLNVRFIRQHLDSFKVLMLMSVRIKISAIFLMKHVAVPSRKRLEGVTCLWRVRALASTTSALISHYNRPPAQRRSAAQSSVMFGPCEEIPLSDLWTPPGGTGLRSSDWLAVTEHAQTALPLPGG